MEKQLMINKVLMNSLRRLSMRIIISLFFMLFTIQANADITTSEEFGDWMMSYYQHPNPSSVAPSIRQAAELHLLNDVENAGPPLFGFIAGAVKQNPKLAKVLSNDLAAIEEIQYGLVLVGIWYANVPDSKNIIATGLKEHPQLKLQYKFLATDPVDILTVSPKKGPWVLDMMWGYFFATGSSEPVIKIISVLPWINESKKDEIIAMGDDGLSLMMTSGAAQWSLTSNARQHKRVLTICEEQISKQPEPISTQLKDVVAEAKKSEFKKN